MARDHARLRLDIWADEDYTDLPCTSQWLYQRLLTHGELSYCGVTDWRPGRLAASAADLQPHDVEMFAAPLEAGDFLIIDRETEEVLIRSFVKHDGLMDKWNLAAAMAREFTAVASKPLRAVIVGELTRLKESHPEYRGWARPDVQKILRRVAMTPAEARERTPESPYQSPKLCPSESPKESPKERVA